MVASIGGCHLQSKRTILIGCTGGHFRGTVCLLSEVGDVSEVPPGQTLNANWAKGCHRVDSEPSRRRTLNAVQVSHNVNEAKRSTQ